MTAENSSWTVVCSDQADPLEERAATLLERGLGTEYPRKRAEEAQSLTGPLLLLGTPGSNPALTALAQKHRLSLTLPEGDPTQEGYCLRAVQDEEQPVRIILGAFPRALIWAAMDLLDALRAGIPLAEQPFDRVEKPHFQIRASQCGILFGNSDETAIKVAACCEDIDYAASLRLNTIVIGMDWPAGCSQLVTHRYFPELADTVDSRLVDQQAAAFSQAIQHAGEWGQDVYLTLTELYYPAELAQRHPEILASAPPRGADRWYRPPGSGFTSLAHPDKLCPSHAVTRAFFRAKIRELAERFPTIAGVQIWVSHGTCDVFYCDCPTCHALQPHERLSRLCQDALDAMDEAGLTRGRVILRTYLGGWRQALAERFFLPLAGQLPKRVIVGTKAQYGDMYYGNAIHPLAGAFPGNDEIIEFCLGGEYRAGLRWGTVAPIADDMARRARIHARLGCTGLWMRHADWRNHLNEVDFRVFGALAWNPFAAIEPIRARWAEERFGTSGPAMIDLLRGCTEVMSKALYARGVSLTHWAVFPENLQRLRHLTMDRSAQATEEGWAKMTPTPANLHYLLREKDDAIIRAEELLGNLEQLAGQLQDADHQAMHRSLTIQRELARLFKGLVDCFWRYLIWERTLSEVQREFQREELLRALQAWGYAITAARPVLAEQYTPEFFRALGTREIVAERAWQPQGYRLDHLEQIRQDILDRIDVEPASVWGYYPRIDEE